MFCLEIEKLEKLRSLYLLWMQKSTANMSIKVRIYTVIYVILFRGKTTILHLWMFYWNICLNHNVLLRTSFLYSTGGYPSSSEAGIKVTTLLCHTPFVWPSLEKEGHEEIRGHPETVVCLISNRKSGKNTSHFQNSRKRVFFGDFVRY